MADMPTLRDIVNGDPADATDVEWNFNTVESEVNANRIHRDGAIAMTGALAMGAQKITGLATPTVATDAATKGYVDANPVPFVIAAETGTTASHNWTTVDVKQDIAGLTATWTADATHIYRIDAQAYWTLSSGAQSHRNFLYATDTVTDKTLWVHESIGSAASGGSFYKGGGFCYLTGLSGSVTWKISGLVTDGASHNTFIYGTLSEMMVTDMGIAP